MVVVVVVCVCVGGGGDITMSGWDVGTEMRL